MTGDENLITGIQTFTESWLHYRSLPIVQEDFVEPLTIAFLPPRKILSVSTLETDPSSINPEWLVHDEIITLNPILLNAGDSIKCAIITDGFSVITVSGRIIGVKEIVEVEELSKGGAKLTNPMRRAVKSVAAIVLVLLFASIATYRFGGNYIFFLIAVLVLLGAGLVVATVADMFRSWEEDDDLEVIMRALKATRRKR